MDDSPSFNHSSLIKVVNSWTVFRRKFSSRGSVEVTWFGGRFWQKYREVLTKSSKTSGSILQRNSRGRGFSSSDVSDLCSGVVSYIESTEWLSEGSDLISEGSAWRISGSVGTGSWIQTKEVLSKILSRTSLLSVGVRWAKDPPEIRSRWCANSLSRPA